MGCIFWAKFGRRGDLYPGLIAMGGPNWTVHLGLKKKPYHNQLPGASSGDGSAVEQKRRLCLWC